VCDDTGQGSAKVASCAQQLLEHSLLTELQGVVARTLQGVDMFSQQQLAGILGHTHTLHASHTDAALPASKVGPSHEPPKRWWCLRGDALWAAWFSETVFRSTAVMQPYCLEKLRCCVLVPPSCFANCTCVCFLHASKCTTAMCNMEIDQMENVAMQP